MHPIAFDPASLDYALPRGSLGIRRSTPTFSWPHLSRQASTLEGLDKFMRDTFLRQTGTPDDDDGRGFHCIPFFTNLCHPGFLALFAAVMTPDMPPTLLLPKLFSSDGLAWRHAVLQPALEVKLRAILHAVLRMAGCDSTLSSSSLDLLALALHQLSVPGVPITDKDFDVCSRLIASCRARRQGASQLLQACLLDILKPDDQSHGKRPRGVEDEVSRLRVKVSKCLEDSLPAATEHDEVSEMMVKQQAVRHLRRAILAVVLRNDRKAQLSSLQDRQIFKEALLTTSLQSLPSTLLRSHPLQDKTASAGGVDGSADGADGAAEGADGADEEHPGEVQALKAARNAPDFCEPRQFT